MSILDLEKLLEPIPGSRVSGSDLRYDPVYHKIQIAREEDDSSLPRGIWERDLKTADWKAVQRLCCQVLSERSKDLQIAFWLLEALTEQHAFQGLAEGSVLSRRLILEFWEDLHPLPAQADMERRLSLFLWLDQKVTFRFRQLPLTRPENTDIESYGYLDWQRALRSLRDQGDAADEDAITMARFEKSVNATSTAFYRTTFALLETAIDEWKQVDDFLYERLGNDKPALNDLFQVLTEMRHKVKTVLAARPPETAPEKPSEEHSAQSAVQAEQQPGQAPSEMKLEEEAMTQSNPSNEPVQPRGPINSRSEAYRLLDEIATYLMRVEPHSPTPYVLKRVAGWKELSLDELLRETITGIDDRARVRDSLFMKPEGES